MNKMKIELFGNEAACVSFEAEGGDGLFFLLPESTEGLISIDGVVKLVTAGNCIFDTRLLPDGEHEPYLLADKKKIPLPKITKHARKIRLAECSSEFVHRISLREQRLAERVRTLERELEKISEKIYGSHVF